MGSRFDYDEHPAVIDVIRDLVARHGPESKIEVVPIGMNALRRLVVEWDAQPTQRASSLRPSGVDVLARLVDVAHDDIETLQIPRGRAREIVEYVTHLEQNAVRA